MEKSMKADKYIIVAEKRGNLGKRVPITDPMSKEDAKNWKASYVWRKHFRYFRVVKYKP